MHTHSGVVGVDAGMGAGCIELSVRVKKLEKRLMVFFFTKSINEIKNQSAQACEGSYIFGCLWSAVWPLFGR